MHKSPLLAVTHPQCGQLERLRTRRHRQAAHKFGKILYTSKLAEDSAAYQLIVNVSGKLAAVTACAGASERRSH